MEIEDLFNRSSDDAAQPNAKVSPLNSLKVDLDFYSDSLREVSSEIIAEGYTLYPIFIAHQHEVKLGELILDKSELNTNWSINVSSLEDFIEAGVIQEDKKEHFIKNYKSADDFMCLFVVVPEGANFVFYPYK